MTLTFNCVLPRGTRGAKEPFVNSAKFKLQSGSVLTIDREETYYSFDDDDSDLLEDIEESYGDDDDDDPYDNESGATLSMDWENCYIWAIDDYHIFSQETVFLNNEDAVSLLEDAELLELEIEDDAPEGYEIEVDRWIVS